MGTSLSIFNSRKLPRAFVSGVILFFVIQLVVVETAPFWHIVYFFSDPGPDDGIRLEAQLREIPNNNEKEKVFLIGSSQTREDFDVDYLNARLKEAGVSFYNLGVSGGQPIEMFMMKDRFLL